MLNWVLKTMKQSLGPIRFSLVRFFLFWGLPCPLPLTRANDDVLYIKASNRGRRKAFWNQRKWIWSFMVPFWGVSIFCPDKRIVIALWYAFPLFIAGIIAIAVGQWTIVSGSAEIRTRKELVKLRTKALMQTQPRESAVLRLSRSDVTFRMSHRRQLLMSGWHLKKSSFGPRAASRRV